MKVSLDHGARLNQIVELAARNSLPVMGFGREVLDSTPRVARTLLRRGDFGPAYVSSRSIATGRGKLQLKPCPQCPVSNGRPEKGGLSLRAQEETLLPRLAFRQEKNSPRDHPAK
jgi:hypothetical protein